MLLLALSWLGGGRVGLVGVDLASRGSRAVLAWLDLACCLSYFLCLAGDFLWGGNAIARLSPGRAPYLAVVAFSFASLCQRRPLFCSDMVPFYVKSFKRKIPMLSTIFR